MSTDALIYLQAEKSFISEMKGDIGMSPHEKEGEQEDDYTKTETHCPFRSQNVLNLHTSKMFTKPALLCTFTC